MFSTYAGAKRRAKQLNKTLFECSIIFPLSHCQNALAHAQGFGNWHELKSSIGSVRCAIEPALFKRRLMNVLPESCRRTADYWVDRRSFEWADEESPISMEFRNWYYMVNPYFFSLMVGFNRSPALLQPGSGKGQRLRKTIVQLALQNGMMHHSESGCFKLNPTTLSVQKTAPFYEFFSPEIHQHKDFKTELQRVADAGILSWTPKNEKVGTIEIFPPSKQELMDHVAACRRNHDPFIQMLSEKRAS
ncbi:hypothetical protein [Hyphococcus luteus]|uniref:Uncharacterized protein n=1 Tax=Hyphococcus luteus TaxID=2058213 RepID=A0A2S7K517_9PROT|nr:hypothetical protein [Marinicaulis flavus]PQA87566.1 hypothetical protein CW354_10810 [Marinicaulis flavus]